MDSKSFALIFVVNVLFFAHASACASCPFYSPEEAGPNPNPTEAGPNPNPTSYPNSFDSCSRDALTLGACADVLSSLLNMTVSRPLLPPCCSLLHGLGDLQAAVCLCTAIRANILGVNLNIPLSLRLLLNVCERQVPYGFLCA